jgi:hypothetical protein
MVLIATIYIAVQQSFAAHIFGIQHQIRIAGPTPIPIAA